MTITLTEIAEVEQTEEYILDQLAYKLDERLALLRSRLDATHASDREFDRYLRQTNRTVVLCEQCRKETSGR